VQRDCLDWQMHLLYIGVTYGLTETGRVNQLKGPPQHLKFYGDILFFYTGKTVPTTCIACIRVAWIISVYCK